ncbi:DUF6236 family protein [Delftia sp. CH05]|uniref:DUF6236 family protein n=1 Tax=Delftia sp. CH05 TaxID=2692194 RepID=UPI00135D4C6D|nr:DUF6236 family protein [Delftia sp. CH05]MXN30118.1 hypothetical protein [Delftia sp. CH05]
MRISSSFFEEDGMVGESRQRKLSDPGYGVRPKGGNGIMLVPSFQEGKDGTLETRANLSAESLRFALCFWECIAWPSVSYFKSEDSNDIAFLSSTGVLRRPEIQLQPASMSVGKSLAEAYFRAYRELEAQDPGRWSLSAESEFDIRSVLGDQIVSDRGITVTLHRAIPIPTGDTPLADLLEFKRIRAPELMALRAELGQSKRLITGATDRAEELAVQWDRIDAACKDLLTVAREVRMPVRIADFSVGMEINGGALAGLGVAAYNLLSTNDFMTSLGLAAASCIKLSSTYGTRKDLMEKSPFRYVHHLHEEIDWIK